MKRVRVVVVFAVAVLASGLLAAPAAEARTGRALKLSGVGHWVAASGNCCGSAYTWSGALSGSPVGRSTFTVDMLYGHFSPTDDPSRPQLMQLRITTKDGSLLVLEGTDDTRYPSRTWSVASWSTGKFAGWTGSGSYETNMDYANGYGGSTDDITVDLRGTLFPPA